jgi:hypothetical protein
MNVCSRMQIVCLVGGVLPFNRFNDVRALMEKKDVPSAS